MGSSADVDATAQTPRGGAKAALLHVLWVRGETIVPLIERELVIGRSPANQVTIESQAVDDVHARLVREGTSYRFFQLSGDRPTLLRGKPVDDYLLQPGDRLEIAPGTADAVTLIYEAGRSMMIGDLYGTPGTSPDEASAANKVWRLDLPANGTLVMGRSPDCDLVLPALTVTLQHARLTIRNGQPVISEIGSTSGTFVNGKRVHTHTLADGDVVRVGPYKILFHGDIMEYQDDRKAVRLDARNVTRFIGKHQILDDISFRAQPGEVLAIAGTSGAGKSTLLYALTGIIPPTEGHVMVNGSDLYTSFAALQPLLDYVPQKDIPPLQLPVQRALHYVARLRLPPDVTNDEMNARIEEVMRSLDLYDRRDVLLGSLSGGQQKRASIAAELIGKPGFFFLDEPASGLDPGLARRVSAIMRDMANTNSTIVVISHDVEGLQAADKIVLLASGGRVAFIGAPQEALEYFDVDDLADVYPRVESEDSKVWQKRFEESPHYADLRFAGVGAGGRRGARRRISRPARHRCALRRQAAHSDGRASVHGVRDALRRDDAERQANAASPVGAGAGDRAAPDSRRQVDRLSTSACRSDLTGGGVRHSSSEAGGDAADHAGGDGHVVRSDQRRS